MLELMYTELHDELHVIIAVDHKCDENNIVARYDSKEEALAFMDGIEYVSKALEETDNLN